MENSIKIAPVLIDIFSLDLFAQIFVYCHSGMVRILHQLWNLGFS